MGNLIEMIGRRFGKLEVIALDPERRPPSRAFYWVCRCDCGNVVSVWGSNLRRKTRGVRSCGCANPRFTTHGDHGSPENLAWRSIKARCFNPKNASYPLYGGRGITMAEKWVDDYPAFLAHVSRRPSSSHSLDRIDNDGHYEPGNVRWATDLEQNSNLRTNVRVLVNGESVPLVVIARQEGMSLARARYLLRTGRYYPRVTGYVPPKEAGQKTSDALEQTP